MISLKIIASYRINIHLRKHIHHIYLHLTAQPFQMQTFQLITSKFGTIIQVICLDYCLPDVSNGVGTVGKIVVSRSPEKSLSAVSTMLQRNFL